MRMIIAFEKTDTVRHVGHLDLMRAMQRALRRSGLPIRYSQGFNPHVLLAFASPLPVGVSGDEELMEVAMEADVAEAAFADALRPSMPASLPLVSVRAVTDQHPKLMAALRSAQYRATMPRNDAAEAMAGAIPALLAREAIPAIRKTKSGERPCDIRPMLYALEADTSQPDVITFVFRSALTERDTLKPDLLFACLAEQAGVEAPAMRLRRLRLYAEADRRPVGLLQLQA